METKESKEQYLKRLRKLFENDSFATKVVGVVIEEADVGYAKCSVKIKPEHLNAGGHLMGGVIFTLADLAFAVATNCGRSGTVTLSSQMYFLKTVRDGTLYAEAKSIRQGGKIGVYEVNVYDDKGDKVAFTTCEGFTL